MFTVYVLVDSRGRRYTGHTSDLARRLAEHNSGCCKTTKVSNRWFVTHTEEFESRSEAMKRERWLKSGTGRSFLTKLLAGWSPPEAE